MTRTLALALLVVAGLSRPAAACDRAYVDVFSLLDACKFAVVAIVGKTVKVERTLRGKAPKTLALVEDGECDIPVSTGERFIGFFLTTRHHLHDKWHANAETVQALIDFGAAKTKPQRAAVLRRIIKDGNDPKLVEAARVKLRKERGLPEEDE